MVIAIGSIELHGLLRLIVLIVSNRSLFDSCLDPNACVMLQEFIILGASQSSGVCHMSVFGIGTHCLALS